MLDRPFSLEANQRKREDEQYCQYTVQWKGVAWNFSPLIILSMTSIAIKDRDARIASKAGFQCTHNPAAAATHKQENALKLFYVGL